MSEQQKDSSGGGAADSSENASITLQSAGQNGGATGTEATKPKKRSSTKGKAAPEAGDELAKPRRARASSNSSKAKSVLMEALPGGEAQPASSLGPAGSSQLELIDLPPLPPAPVPTPEGVAFMQQHVAYQSALEQRSELRRAQLERSGQASKANSGHVRQEPDNSNGRSRDPAVPTSASARDAGVPADAAAAKAPIAKTGRGPRENSIEAGPDIQKAPTSDADVRAVHDAEDARLLHQLLERSRALRERGNVTSAAEPAVAVAQSDVGTLRMIRDPAARKLGLAVVDRNRHEAPDYKVEFDKLAPDLKAEAQEATTGTPSNGRQSGILSEKAEDDVARLNAVPESVRKRFLKVDSDYFFPDRSPAFVDRGARLATRGEHPEVVVALVEIAKERGWNSVTVKGSEAFRRAAWTEAVRNGLQVAGYKPTEIDLAQVTQRDPTNMVVVGLLKEKGDKAERPVDHALNEKLSAFANERPTLVVKKYPDLVQAYALLDAARKFAEVHMPGRETQFVAIGKEMIKQQLREGREVIGPRVHPDQIDRARAGHDKSVAGVAKAPQSDVLVRER